MALPDEKSMLILNHLWFGKVDAQQNIWTQLFSITAISNTDTFNHYAITAREQSWQIKYQSSFMKA